MIDDVTRGKLRQRLEEERDRLLSELNTAERDYKEMTADQMDENTVSNHYGDAGAHLEELDRIAIMQENTQELLKQVENALRRMDEGTYGLSEVSGKEIPQDRLEALPQATRLVGEEEEQIIR